MANRDEVSFEVQVLTGGRWETQGVYEAREEQRALADAKSLEQVSTIRQVKVVKEFHDPKTKATRIFTVYESHLKPGPQERGTPAAGQEQKPRHAARKPQPVARRQPSSKPAKAKSAKSKSPAAGAGGSPTEDMLAAPGPEAAGDGKPRMSLLSAFLQTIVSLVAALIAAMVVTQLAGMYMRGMPSIGFLSRDDFLILVFILVFVVTALALVTRILTKLRNVGPIMLPPTAPRPRAHAPRPKPKPERKFEPIVPEQPVQEEAEEDRPEAEAAQEEAPAEEAPEETEEEALPTEAIGELITMNAFNAGIMDSLKAKGEKPDAHVVFGVVLFLVGAVHALRTQHRLQEPAYRAVMRKALSALGLSKERTDHFIEHTDEYLVTNARYSEMFQHGRNAMTGYLETNTGPRAAFDEALDGWEHPKTKADIFQAVTVLFTDIAGSTAMTQRLGDAGAQEVVRAHNTIVRDALKVFGGKEVKHTGDGIMASFTSGAAGVEAAIDMQRKTKVHNAAHPDLPLGLKIGLNAGEPISEDDDLFGTTVQLAARIVDKAGAGQILVSSSVHGLSQGKTLKFERFGDLAMKGFDEPITVYMAQWDDEPEAHPQQTPQQMLPETSPQTPPAEPQPQPQPQPEPRPEPAAVPQAEPAPAGEEAPQTPAGTEGPAAEAQAAQGAQDAQDAQDVPAAAPEGAAPEDGAPEQAEPSPSAKS